MEGYSIPTNGERASKCCDSDIIEDTGLQAASRSAKIGAAIYLPMFNPRDIDGSFQWCPGHGWMDGGLSTHSIIMLPLFETLLNSNISIPLLEWPVDTKRSELAL